MHFSRWGANLFKANNILNSFEALLDQLNFSRRGKPACSQGSFAVGTIDLTAKVHLLFILQFTKNLLRLMEGGHLQWSMNSDLWDCFEAGETSDC